MALALALEVHGGNQFERDSGETRGYALQAERTCARGGVVQFDLRPAYLAQHDEMIEVPMQNRGYAQIPNFLKLDSQRSRTQSQSCRDVHQRGERDALEGDRKASPQSREIHIETMVRSDHRHARQPAFRSFGLSNQRQSAPACEIEQSAPHIRSRAANSGASSHSPKLRSSKMMSADSAMPDLSSALLPYVSLEPRCRRTRTR